MGPAGLDAASSLSGGAGEREMWVDRLIGRKCSSRVRLDTTRRSETQPERAAAVGRVVGRREVGRSGRRRARWLCGPIAEGRGVARSSAGYASGCSRRQALRWSRGRSRQPMDVTCVSSMANPLRSTAACRRPARMACTRSRLAVAAAGSSCHNSRPLAT